MKDKIDNPGVFIPPPLFYLGVYGVSLLLQDQIPLSKVFFHSFEAHFMAVVLIFVGCVFLYPAFREFFKTKNTLLTMKPTMILQTTGIYAQTRNPIYVGFLFFYIGFSLLIGNWWSMLLTPLVILLVQTFVIKKEEAYLERKFGNTYRSYRQRVKRWLW